jgi:hypothetical protein
MKPDAMNRLEPPRLGSMFLEIVTVTSPPPNLRSTKRQGYV